MKDIIVFLLVTVSLASAQRDGPRAPPQLLQPRDERIEYKIRKSNFSFVCEAQGVPSPSYQWYVEERGQEGRPRRVASSRYVSADNVTGELHFRQMSERDEGRYFCHAANPWGVAASSSLHLRIVMIEAFPTEGARVVQVKEGEAVSLPCRSAPRSQPPPSFSWFKEERQPDKDQSEVRYHDSRVSADINNTLYISHATAGDSGVYSCAAWNSQQSTANLGSKTDLVVEPIAGQVQPRGVRVLGASRYVLAQLGDTAWLQCFFSAMPKVTKVSWFLGDSQPLPEGDGRLTFPREERLTLQVERVREEDEGWYTCSANNDYGPHSARLYLNVTSKPIWTRPLVSRTVKIGDDVTFTCGTRPAKGERPIGKPQWFRNTEAINESTLMEDDRMTLSKDGVTLKIRNVSRDHDLMCLQCRASNEIGSVFRNAYLNVLVPTNITERPPKALTMMYGDAEDVTVRATSDPSQNLTFTWRVEGRTLTPGTPPLVLNISTGEITLDSSTVPEEDWEMYYYGEYVVRISHPVQTVNVTFHVINPNATTSTATPTTPGALAASDASAGSLWWLALVIAAVVIIAIVAIVVYMKVNKYPRQTYLLGKKEEKSNLDPKKDLAAFDFQRL